MLFLNFHGWHLREIEFNPNYSSVRICILSKNFLTDISPLRNCVKLIKLDLHSNQIKFLPDATFWGEMTELKLLYLHDNSFVKLKNMCSLSGCPKLLALTMYDCPVSLKKGYRHVIVNSIWSLKLLDHYVISDEEVIENWTLPERFKSFTKQLSCDITPLLLKILFTKKLVQKKNMINNSKAEFIWYYHFFSYRLVLTLPFLLVFPLLSDKEIGFSCIYFLPDYFLS
uniref:Leucine rich repeats and IQ motif containing 3 n=1 Tax=Monodelphis domestica TaxID=13616 RepID=F6XDZ3_MONDO